MRVWLLIRGLEAIRKRQMHIMLIGKAERKFLVSNLDLSV